jgi:hypothetical protein
MGDDGWRCLGTRRALVRPDRLGLGGSIAPTRRGWGSEDGGARYDVAPGHRQSRSGSAGEEAQPHRSGLVVGVRIEQADRLPCPEGQPAAEDRHGQRRRRQQRQDVVRAVPRRSVSVAVVPVLARQQSIERIEQVVIGARADFDDDQARRRVGHEDGEQAVLGVDVGEERGAGRGQVGQAASRPGPDREFAGLYGKMLRSASRILPRLPIAGTDS